MTVAVGADGSADIIVVSTFDLDSDDEQAAFDTLQNNETSRSAYTTRFRDRWSAVANNTQEQTGRQMAITDTSLDLSREGSTGVATLRVTWDSLATVEDGTLTLSEPFESEFSPDRQFTVVLPDGYAVDTVTPEPTTQSSSQVKYDAGTALSGFELVAQQQQTDAQTTGDGGPGFGVIGALAALFAVGLLARRRA
jgi:PGF-CTERM protein